VLNNSDGSNAFLDYGIMCLSSKPLIANNLISGNECGCYIGWHASDGAQFINNTVVNNLYEGLWCYQSNPVVKNNILTGNSSGVSASFDFATPVLSYNDSWGNHWLNYDAQSTGVINIGTGSISVDPLFLTTAPGDYRLAPASPCRDAGDPAATYNDLDGSRNDLGATGGPCGSAAPPGSVVDGFLWTSVGTIPVADIDQTTGAKGGLTLVRDRPFGGQPWLYGPFGSNETTVYRYAIKVGKWTGSTPPAPAAFTYVDDPLSKVRYTVSGGTITTSNVSLGPVTFAGVPCYTPTVNGGGIYWAHENLRVILNTLSLDEGRYSVRLEGYTFLSSLVTLSPNRDLILTINNTPPVVRIDQLSFAGGMPLDECAIIDLPTPTSPLNFVYTANHPDGFLDDYALVVEVGRNRSGGVIVSDSYASHVSPTAVWNGVTMAPVAATPANPEQPLPALQQWERCAYQFTITAWARTTNGFGRIYWTTYFDNHAIDLGGGGSPADMDGDGDVDAADLALFAAAYGTVAP
jgi:parallel beta-helix repeat protein